jgi:hypothetical protein
VINRTDLISGTGALNVNHFLELIAIFAAFLRRRKLARTQETWLWSGEQAQRAKLELKHGGYPKRGCATRDSASQLFN